MAIYIGRLPLKLCHGYSPRRPHIPLRLAAAASPRCAPILCHAAHATAPRSIPLRAPIHRRAPLRLACRGHGVHRATTTPAPPGEGLRQPGHCFPWSTEHTTAGNRATTDPSLLALPQFPYRKDVAAATRDLIKRCCAESACCKHMFQVFHICQRYVASVSYGCCKSRS